MPASICRQAWRQLFSGSGCSSAALQLTSYRTIAAIRGRGRVTLPGREGSCSRRGVVRRSQPVRWFTDVDVLVRRQDFGKVIDGLVEGRFRRALGQLERLPRPRGVRGAARPRPDSTVDLHWHLVGIGAERRELAWEMAPLFERAERISLGSDEVATLDAEDTLLHLCINGGLDGAGTLIRTRRHRRRRTERPGRLDGVRRPSAGTARAGALCAAVLQRCASIVGTPLPHGLLAELEPFRGWLRVNVFVDRRRRSGRRLTNGVASGASARLGTGNERPRLSGDSAGLSCRTRCPS